MSKTEPSHKWTSDVGAEAEIWRYTAEMTDQTDIKPLEPHEALPFRRTCHTTYPRLAPLAEDHIAAPACQAYVERISSLCELSARKQSRARTGLMQCVFLKMNSTLLK